MYCGRSAGAVNDTECGSWRAGDDDGGGDGRRAEVATHGALKPKRRRIEGGGGRTPEVETHGAIQTQAVVAQTEA